MGAVIECDSGGEWAIPWAKKKLGQIKLMMLRAKVPSFSKQFYMTDGTQVFLNSVGIGHGAFRDKIRIKRGGAFWLQTNNGSDDHLYKISFGGALLETISPPWVVTPATPSNTVFGWAISGEYFFANNSTNAPVSMTLDVYDHALNLISSTDLGVKNGGSVCANGDTGQVFYGPADGMTDIYRVDHLGAILETFAGAAPVATGDVYIHQAGSIYNGGATDLQRMVLSSASLTTVPGTATTNFAFAANDTHLFAGMGDPNGDKIQMYNLDLSLGDVITIPGMASDSIAFSLVADNGRLFVVGQNSDASLVVGVVNLSSLGFTPVTNPLTPETDILNAMQMGNQFA